MEKCSAVLAAYSELARCGLRSMLADMAEIGVQGEITCVEQASRLAVAEVPEPDVLLMVLEANGCDVVSFLATIRELWPTTKIVVIAMQYDVENLRELAELDLSGYLLWEDLTTEGIRHCLAAVLERSIVVTSQAVARAFIQEERSFALNENQRPHLTVQEVEILRALSHGCTQREVALQTGNSFRSVSRITSRLAKKLNSPSQFALGATAARLGFLEQSNECEYPSSMLPPYSAH